nr:unnamed protein product [Digitaria exilis]
MRAPRAWAALAQRDTRPFPSRLSSCPNRRRRRCRRLRHRHSSSTAPVRLRLPCLSSRPGPLLSLRERAVRISGPGCGLYTIQAERSNQQRAAHERS